MTADWPPDLAERFGRRILARTYRPGRLRAVTLGQDPPRAAHLAPELPRAVMRWAGEAKGWKLVAIVPDLRAAQALMRPAGQPRPEPW
ncbi:DUF6087 family protein [Streptomyces sp. NPDC057654]|uniref:DUF6087 family protein n=1 Tax=Streptomyces sp. NPDC057654 TaxID=3346196 RepID=UPI0036953865